MTDAQCSWLLLRPVEIDAPGVLADSEFAAQCALTHNAYGMGKHRRLYNINKCMHRTAIFTKAAKGARPVSLSASG